MNKPNQIGNKGVSEPIKGSIQCWGGKGPDLYRYWTFKNNVWKTIYNLHNVTIINGIEKCPRIYASLENRHTDYQPSAKKVEGMISTKLIVVLIDIGSNIIYVSPNIV